MENNDVKRLIVLSGPIDNEESGIKCNLEVIFPSDYPYAKPLINIVNPDTHKYELNPVYSGSCSVNGNSFQIKFRRLQSWEHHYDLKSVFEEIETLFATDFPLIWKRHSVAPIPQKDRVTFIPQFNYESELRESLIITADDLVNQIGRQKTYNESLLLNEQRIRPVSYTHLTLPTIYSV
eukprot:TRINITY_DN7735_c0_g1_i6.p1 TRINITY_DN7735_c0_g1~~TRINITY_DN7735_c0_g1_i6.p1  ORF type:complete len:179 (-),score=19.07 TRINITY_DN7735_c0_g1_i6:43-579(-)